MYIYRQGGLRCNYCKQLVFLDHCYLDDLTETAFDSKLCGQLYSVTKELVLPEPKDASDLVKKLNNKPTRTE